MCVKPKPEPAAPNISPEFLKLFCKDADGTLNFREDLLFPEFSRRSLRESDAVLAALPLHTLTDLGLKRSPQAEKAGFIMIRPFEKLSKTRGIPGLWLHPSKMNLLAEAVRHVAQLRAEHAAKKAQAPKKVRVKTNRAGSLPHERNEKQEALHNRKYTQVEKALAQAGFLATVDVHRRSVEAAVAEASFGGKRRSPASEMVDLVLSAYYKVVYSLIRDQQALIGFAYCRNVEILTLPVLASHKAILPDAACVGQSRLVMLELWRSAECPIDVPKISGEAGKPEAWLDRLRNIFASKTSLNQGEQRLLDSAAVAASVEPEAALMAWACFRSLAEVKFNSILDQALQKVALLEVLPPQLQETLKLCLRPTMLLDDIDTLGDKFISFDLGEMVIAQTGWGLHRSPIRVQRTLPISFGKTGQQFTLKILATLALENESLRSKNSHTLTYNQLASFLKNRAKITSQIDSAMIQAQEALGVLINPFKDRLTDAEMGLIKGAINGGKSRYDAEQGVVVLRHATEQIRAILAKAKLRIDHDDATSDLRSYPLGFPAARLRKRKITFFAGPTNSGKTYRGIELLKRAADGVYLAPLRLLALEGQRRLISAGVPCSLVTGEERDLVAEAHHIAQTIETVDLDWHHSVALIDEVQFLVDPQRGWAWTQALVGVNADHVVLTGCPDAIPLVRQIVQDLGEEIEIVTLERLAPLTVCEKTFSYKEVPPRAAIICFSRRGVLGIRDYLISKGRTVACLYGSLSPETRRLEAERFTCGAADVLIATDAIGYGLNLPIDYIIFAELEKFDGSVRRPLTSAEIRQIGGRAGRFGLATESTGFVSLINSSGGRDGYKRLLRALQHKDKPAPLGRAGALPSYSHFRLMARRTGSSFENSLQQANRYFTFREDWTTVSTEALNGIIYRASIVSKAELRLSARVDDWDRWQLVTAAADERDEGYYQSLVSAVVGRIPLKHQRPVKNVDGQTLESAEKDVKKLTLYRSFAFKWPDLFPEGDSADIELRRLAEGIASCLASQNIVRGCAGCGKIMEPLSYHRMCDTCWGGGNSAGGGRKHFYSNYDDDDSDFESEYEARKRKQ